MMKYTKWKSRKFWLTFLFAVITVNLIYADKVDGAIGLGILGVVLGVYKATNVLEKTNPIINGNNDSPTN